MARKSDSHHVLPLFCDDLIASCVDMTPACFGAYMRLLCYAWTRGGIPDNEASCSRIAGGLEPDEWQQIRERLTVLEDGRLSHDRLERERVAVAEMSAKKSEAGKKGNVVRWGGGNDRKTIAERSQTVSQSDRKPIAPYPSLILEENTHTHTAAGDDFRQPGWAADEWQRFVAEWNATGRAVPWTALGPPSTWVDYAASPGWLGRAREAMARLPSCQWFEQSLAVTRFFDYVDRILAGEFDNAKSRAGTRGRQMAGGNL